MSAYDGTEMRSTYVAVDGKFEVLLLVASLVSLDGINFGFIEGTELWISNERVIGTTLGEYYGTELGLS